MAQYVKKIRTSDGDLPIDYNSLANLPSAGSATQPVYMENGAPKITAYTLGASVPANAKFTDTTYTLSSFGITSTAAELNILDGVTATAAELNCCDGVTSNIQTQLNGKAASSHNHDAGNITSGTLPISRGGTGATTAAGILANLGNIGQVYSYTPNATSVPAYGTTTVASLTLPVGTYIVVANSQWSDDVSGAMYMHRLATSDQKTVYGTTRGFMIGGGGAQTTAIVSLTAQTTIIYQAYNGHSSALNSEAISLKAVKLQ